MYIDTVPNRNSPPAILLREGWREGGKVKKRTLANLSKWPPEVVEGLRVLLKGGTAVRRLPEAFEIERSLPHGHAAAALGAIERLGLPRLIDPRPSPQRDRVVALIAARILHPGSKLAAARGLAEETARDTLGEALELGEVSEDDLYAAMDWLLTRQDAIERRLAKRRLKEGTLVLYDLTSVYLEGRRCPLAKRGHSRDGKRGKLQIEFGLLCDAEGCPVAVEVFKGNAADPMTVGAQIKKLKDRFGLKRVVLVGDRGMLTGARIREEVEPAGLDWIGALRSSAIRSLVESGAVQMSLFDQTDLIEVRSDAYPGERLMVCRNPQLAQERAFRSLKTVDLKVRPVFHYTAGRVRAHILLCMLAYYVEWHMRGWLKPLLFDDEDPDAAEAARASVVAPAKVSESAQRKARSKRTANGLPVHSFQTLLADLATVAKNRVIPRLPGAQPFTVVTRPTALQSEAFRLLGVRLKRTQ